MPKICLSTLSLGLRRNLIATGQYITAIPNMVLHSFADRFLLKVLPLELPFRPWPVAIIKLKSRTLSPVAERFIESGDVVINCAAYTKVDAARLMDAFNAAHPRARR